MAAEEINAAGGVLGQAVQVFHADDQTSPAVARDAASSLISTKRVAAIIGSLSSGSCLAIVEVARSSGVPEVAPGCTSPLFSNLSLTGGWFARTAPSDALQGVVAASYSYVNLSLARAAVIASDSAYGRGVAASFIGNFTRLRGTISAGSPRYVQESATDYTTDLHAILDAAPPPLIVYVAMYPPSGTIMMRNWWSGLGSNPGWRNMTWIFSEVLYDQTNFIDPLVAGGVDVRGFLGTSPAAYADRPPPRYPAWAARYRTLYGELPQLFAANAYDAVYLIALAAQAAGFAGGGSIRAQLRIVANPPGTVIGPDEWSQAVGELTNGRDVDYEGASGSITLDALGDPLAAHVIWAVNVSNGLYVKEFFSETLVSSLLPPGLAARVPSGPMVLAEWVVRPSASPSAFQETGRVPFIARAE
jgi:ABC-type branched-subunit amino acid transport system substrate-binding protein